MLKGSTVDVSNINVVGSCCDFNHGDTTKALKDNQYIILTKILMQETLL